MSNSCEPDDQYFIIRNPKCGLVLDASEYQVKLQHFTGYPDQLWKLDSVGRGKFIITNRRNGKVLDIQNGVGEKRFLITYGRHGGANQQWHINSDNTIVCPTGNFALDLTKYHAGIPLIVYPVHGGDNQQFILQPQ